MAALILPSRRVVQPQGPVEVDWGNSLASRLLLDSRGDQLFRDVAGARIPTQSVGSLTRSATSYGFAATFASAVTSFGDVELFTGARATWQVIELPSNLTQVAGLVNKRASGTAQNAYSFGYNYNAANEFTVDIGDSAGTAVGTNYRFSTSIFSAAGNNLFVVIDGQAGTGQKIKLFRNGVAAATTLNNADNAFSSFTNTTYPLEIGRVNNGTLYYAGKILLIRAWDRAMADGEVKALSDNPWQLYRPLQRRIWVPVAGGGSTATPSGASSAAISGTMSASGDAATSKTGAQGVAAAGAVAAAGGATALPAGTSSTGAAGTIAGTGAATTSPAGAQASAESGTVSANSGGSISVAPLGAASAASAGTLTVTTSSVASAPGAQAQGQAGAVVAGDPALQAKGGGMPAYYVYDSSTEEKPAKPTPAKVKTPAELAEVSAPKALASTPSLTQALVDRFVEQQIQRSTDARAAASQLLGTVPTAFETLPVVGGQAVTLALTPAQIARRLDDEEAIALLLMA